MRFYKDILSKLHQICTDPKNKQIIVSADEAVVGLVATKAKKLIDFDDDKKATDIKSATKEQLNVADLAEFMIALFYVSAETTLRKNIFNFLKEKGFEYNFSAKDELELIKIKIALLKFFLEKQEIKFNEILDWVKGDNHKSQLLQELVKHIINHARQLSQDEQVSFLQEVIVLQQPLAASEKLKLLLMQLLLEVKEKIGGLDRLHSWIKLNDKNDFLLIVYAKRFPHECSFSPERNIEILKNWLNSSDNGFFEILDWIKINNHENVLFKQISLHLKTNPSRLTETQIAALSSGKVNPDFKPPTLQARPF